MSDYLQKLASFPSLQQPHLVQDFFEMCLDQIGDLWRRLVHSHASFPHKLFALCDLDHDEFLAQYRLFQGIVQQCETCADMEFTHMVLSYIPISSSPAATREKVLSLQLFLKDVATFAPMSTDLVECLHGFYQSKLHRWRGCKPTDPVAQERTTWVSITRSFGTLRKWIWDRFGDVRGRNRIARILPKGMRKCEQKYSSVGKITFEDLAAGKHNRPPRKLCGTLAVTHTH